MHPLLAVLATIASAVVVLAAGFVIGMRRKSVIVQRPIIWFGKNVFNRTALRTAGAPGNDTAIIRHTGRRSGRTFETPADVTRFEDGFLVALPYGTRSQWLRNVLATGGATFVYDGEAHVVDSPVMRPLAPVATAFPEGDRTLFRLFNVTDALQVRRVSSTPVETAAA